MCVLTNERYKAYQMVFLLRRLGHAPGGDFGALGAPGGKNCFISNMVNWHIKSTGMTSKTECKSIFHPMVKLMTLGEVKRSNIIKF